MRPYPLALALLALLIVLPQPSVAGPPDLDLFAAQRPSDPSQTAPLFEPRLGVPTFLWAAQDPRAPRATFDTAQSVARRYLQAQAHRIGASPHAIDELRMTHLHDTGVGAIVVRFEAEVEGVPLFRDQLKVVLNQALTPIAISGYLHPLATGARPIVAEHALQPKAAIGIAAADLAGAQLSPSQLHQTNSQGSFQRFKLGPLDRDVGTALLSAPIRTRRVYFGLPSRLEPAYHLELQADDPQSANALLYAYVISAQDGRILFRKNLSDDADFSYLVYADAIGRPTEGPQGDAWLPHPTATLGPFVEPVAQPNLITLDHGPISTLDPWLVAGSTITRGNNVEAYADHSAPDGLSSGDFHAVTTSSAGFSYPYDPALDADANNAQANAAITQMFYTINYLHDWFYDRGFDESAFNAQEDNYGRDGEGEDSIKAEAQDYRGRNNANMSTPADGARPRMQMYIWTNRPNAQVQITAPAALQSGLLAVGASFGPAQFQTAGTLALVDDGDGALDDGCQSPYANPAAIAGRIAVVRRGGCTFGVKAENAEQAGAIGLVIANNIEAALPNTVGGSSSASLPTLSITQTDGDALIGALTQGATISASLIGAPRADRDSGLDNVIVAHEWGHYLSNRLIGNSVGISGNQARGMGEGWSDFVSLLLMVTEDDGNLPANAGYAGTYGVGVNSSWKNPYFGIRRVPYSIDFSKNALTFGHIEADRPLPTGVPTAFGLDGASNAAVHRTGEVWATMLWECYAALLNDPTYTFDQAQDRMIRYLVTALKITPMAPTMLEAKEAVLAAAFAQDLYDFELFFRAFARRGAGIGATGPDRSANDNSPVQESFLVGGDLSMGEARLDDELAWCDRDSILDSGETGRLTIKLQNTGVGTLSAITGVASSTNANVTLPAPAFSFPPIGPFELAQTTVEVQLSNTNQPQLISIRLEVTDPDLVVDPTVTTTVSFRVHADELDNASTIDTVETERTTWSVDRDQSLDTRFDWSRLAVTAGDHRWFGPNPGAPADIYLSAGPWMASTSTPTQIRFLHRYDLEATWDGGVIETSTDGVNWMDVGNLADQPYDGALRNNTANPLEGREAYHGTNPSYPAQDLVTVDLGNLYAGQAFYFRFRIGSDQAVAAQGWEIDDIEVIGIDGSPFPALVGDRGLCVNRPPIADAGPDFSAPERSLVTLDPSASSDIDGDPLAFAWQQLDGPQVVWMGPAPGNPPGWEQFTAPEVTEDTPLRFQLTANDGQLNTATEIVVTVLQVNRAPELTLTPQQDAPERSPLSITAQAIDPDGDPLSFTWAQVSGPAVQLGGAQTATVSFTTPEIEQTTPVVLSVTASDGALSATATTTIEVLPINRPPELTVPERLTVESGATETIQASASDPDGDPLSFTWRQDSGPSAQLSANGDALVLTAPEVQTDQELLLTVEVSDGQAQTSAQIRVDVQSPPTSNQAPIANAGPDQTVDLNSSVQLDGSASADPEGAPLRFLWQQLDGPPVTLEASDTANPSFTASIEGTVTLRLVVSDEALSSAPDEVSVTINKPGGGSSQDESGCGCSTSERRQTPNLASLGLLLALLGLYFFRAPRFFLATRGSSELKASAKGDSLPSNSSVRNV